MSIVSLDSANYEKCQSHLINIPPIYIKIPPIQYDIGRATRVYLNTFSGDRLVSIQAGRNVADVPLNQFFSFQFHSEREELIVILYCDILMPSINSTVIHQKPSKYPYETTRVIPRNWIRSTFFCVVEHVDVWQLSLRRSLL